MSTVSVPGKVILMGDHAVVYGKPALLAAINKRLTVTATEGRPQASGHIAAVAAIAKRHFGIKKQIRIDVQSDIPQGYHLGSSAAVAVAVIAAVAHTGKGIWDPVLFNQLAYEAEKLKHGTPSGADNTVVSVGGLLWYRKEFEFLKSAWQLPFAPKLTKFYLVDTGKPAETTGEMVAFAAKQKNLDAFCAENEIETKRITLALQTGNERALVNAMRKGQRTLESLGVVSKKAIAMVRAIEKRGGAAKILGGGGRKGGVGYLLAYTTHPLPAYLPITLGEPGVRLEGVK